MYNHLLNSGDKIAAVNNDRMKRRYIPPPFSGRLCLYLAMYSVRIPGCFVILFIKRTFELSLCLFLQFDWQLRA